MRVATLLSLGRASPADRVHDRDASLTAVTFASSLRANRLRLHTGRACESYEFLDVETLRREVSSTCVARGDLAYAEYELAICYGAAFLWHFNLLILLAGRHSPAPASRNHGTSAGAGLVLSKLPSVRACYSLVFLTIAKLRSFRSLSTASRTRDSGIRFQMQTIPTDNFYTRYVATQFRKSEYTLSSKSF